MKKTLTLVALCTAALYANPYESKQEEIASVKQIGANASMALIKTLGGNLKKHLKAGGPMSALNFCSEKAYELTQKVDDDLGQSVSVKRISLRYRNPGNAPKGNEKTILEAMHTLQSNGVVLPEAMIENIGDGAYKYYKPLKINKGVCLKCHGNISQNVQLSQRMQTLYPEDKATGFAMNDLRGAIVVTVKK